jgi:hypothetical protein
MNDPDTTIPAFSLTQRGRRVDSTVTSSGGGPRIVFPNRQQSFLPPAVFPAVILRFCCRAAMDWPRATFLLTMSLHSPEDQAARVNCSLAILLVAPFSESEQLGSRDRTTTLTSKPVSPVDWLTHSSVRPPEDPGRIQDPPVVEGSCPDDAPRRPPGSRSNERAQRRQPWPV